MHLHPSPHHSSLTPPLPPHLPFHIPHAFFITHLHFSPPHSSLTPFPLIVVPSTSLTPSSPSIYIYHPLTAYSHFSPLIIFPSTFFTSSSSNIYIFHPLTAHSHRSSPHHRSLHISHVFLTTHRHLPFPSQLTHIFSPSSFLLPLPSRFPNLPFTSLRFFLAHFSSSCSPVILTHASTRLPSSLILTKTFRLPYRPSTSLGSLSQLTPYHYPYPPPPSPSFFPYPHPYVTPSSSPIHLTHPPHSSLTSHIFIYPSTSLTLTSPPTHLILFLPSP